MLKIILLEAKTYKLAESVIPHQALFQHQLGYVAYHLIWKGLHTKRDKHHVFFETPQIQNLKRKKMGGMAQYIPTVWKSGRDTSPVSLTKLRPWWVLQKREWEVLY